MSSVATIVQVTCCGPVPSLTECGLKSKLVSVGAVVSGLIEVMATLVMGGPALKGPYKAKSSAAPCDVQFPAWAYCGIVTLQEKTPLKIVPDDGA